LPAVRSALLSVLNGGRGGPAELPLPSLARETAAMALARAETDEARALLVATMMQQGPAGATARRALLAHPPQALKAIVGSGKGHLHPKLIRLLGELGDPRAIGPLRRQLRHKSVTVRAAAAVALARLGDGSVEATARRWLGGAKQGGVLRVAGVEALQLLDAPDAPAAIAALLSSTTTRAVALRLAENAPSAELVGPLTKLVRRGDDGGVRSRALSIIARTAGNAAVEVLLEQLGRADSSTLAALGLARISGPAARSGLERALAGAGEGGARRLILRASIVRYLELGEAVPGLGDELAQALKSSDRADRAVGAFGLTALGLRSAAALVRSDDEVIAAAAARATLAQGGDHARMPCWPVLRGADRASSSSSRGPLREPRPAPARTIACGAALMLGGAPVSAATLAEWAEGGGALAPAAALALARRDGESIRPRLRRRLEGTDPVVRAHVALGLAYSPQADAASLLTRAYRFEANPMVRRAVVRALSARSEPIRRSTLELARRLDPDAAVRGVARAALRGVDVVPRLELPRGAVAWIALQPNAHADDAAIALRAARVIRSDGVAYPVVSAPDGVLLVPGLRPLGGATVQLAP
ncbi:MAG: HEAT repeat domain-containing protein, partial [Deltaproteobacteria bacterium]|nr:HEAT repeat domain-containing protein [Deltaproteobacteria bacterium]MBW2534318.1 HEAT repeat domain-containing protein [Deltaproteobacteria bacterium]